MSISRRAVLLDLDGTYADARGVVPGSAKQAVVAARANGHLLFLCTGRSLALLNDDVLAAVFDGLITSAGGYVVVGSDVLVHHSIPVEELGRLIDLLDARGIHFYIEGNTGLYASPASRDKVRDAVFGGVTDDAVRAQLQKGVGWTSTCASSTRDLLRSDINTVNILASDNPVQTYVEAFGERLTVRDGSVRVFGPNNAEVTRQDISKTSAIALVCEHLDVPWEDTIGYGDGANDPAMIQYVATGVAMGNAVDVVREAASKVTGAPEEDGIRTSFLELGLI